jgi:hypothetical protein
MVHGFKTGGTIFSITPCSPNIGSTEWSVSGLRDLAEIFSCLGRYRRRLLSF